MREYDEHYDITPDRDLRANQNFVDVKDAMEGMSGFDIAPKADEIFPGDITEDYTPYPDEKWGAPINYNPYRDEDYGAPIQPSWWDRFKKSPFENLPLYSGPFDWNFSPEYPSMDITEDLRENEEEIIPNISDLDYFNQFK